VVSHLITIIADNSLMTCSTSSSIDCFFHFLRLIYQTLTPKPVIILEDVSANGYGTMIKTLHDDFYMTKRIVRRLAKYHAAGYFLEHEQV
jgi:hypothetical protein